MDKDHIVVIDVETSGPDVFNHDLLSLYMCTLTSNSTLEVFVKYDHEIKWGSVGEAIFNSYQGEWQKNAEGAADAIIKINNYFDSLNVDSVLLAGHNVSFDYYFLKKLATYSDVGLSKNFRIA